MFDFITSFLSKLILLSTLKKDPIPPGVVLSSNVEHQTCCTTSSSIGVRGRAGAKLPLRLPRARERAREISRGGGARSSGEVKVGCRMSDDC